MKANRKFLHGDEEAVSPVIAVILMVAITVVLAATVYVWVSGFGSQSSNPAKTISLTSNGALSSGFKNYTVASATSGMRYSDMSLTINGEARTFDASMNCSTAPYTSATTTWGVCRGTTSQVASATVSAGDIIYMRNLNAGDTLRVLDASANSVILTLTVG